MKTISLNIIKLGYILEMSPQLNTYVLVYAKNKLDPFVNLHMTFAKTMAYS